MAPMFWTEEQFASLVVQATSDTPDVLCSPMGSLICYMSGIFTS
jgi:hypothetical protein